MTSTIRRKFWCGLLVGSTCLSGVGLSLAGAAETPGDGPAIANPALGITLHGNHETPLGLFIVPWQNAHGDDALNRPAQWLDEAALPLDPDTFRRQVQYQRLIAGYHDELHPATIDTLPAPAEH